MLGLEGYYQNQLLQCVGQIEIRCSFQRRPCWHRNCMTNIVNHPNPNPKTAPLLCLLRFDPLEWRRLRGPLAEAVDSRNLGAQFRGAPHTWCSVGPPTPPPGPCPDASGAKHNQKGEFARTAKLQQGIVLGLQKRGKSQPSITLIRKIGLQSMESIRLNASPRQTLPGCSLGLSRAL